MHSCRRLFLSWLLLTVAGERMRIASMANGKCILLLSRKFTGGGIPPPANLLADQTWLLPDKNSWWWGGWEWQIVRSLKAASHLKSAFWATWLLALSGIELSPSPSAWRLESMLSLSEADGWKEKIHISVLYSFIVWNITRLSTMRSNMYVWNWLTNECRNSQCRQVCASNDYLSKSI